MTGSMVDAALEDATAVTMSTDNHAIGSNSIEDELDSVSLEATTGRVNKKKAYLSIFRVEAIKALLDHMVAIKILDQLNNPIMQSDDDHMNLLASGDELNHLLQGTRAMLIESNLDHRGSGIVDQDCTLLVGGELEKLLAKIISKRIGHEFDDVLVGLEEDQMYVFRVTSL